jgi:pSer/pThr/pTyr-binding forkhead associated (FHA) protein
MKAELVPLDGGAAIELVKELTVVGRNEEADLRLDRRSVSKSHCVLVKTDGFLFVRDLASTNGTKVNGQRVRRAALLPGDQLSIGGAKFHVRLGPDDPASESQLATDALRQSELEAVGAEPEPELDPPTPRLRRVTNGMVPRKSDESDSDVLPVPFDPTSVDDDPTAVPGQLANRPGESSHALPALEESDLPLPPLADEDLKS